MNPLVPGRILTWQTQLLKRFTLAEGGIFSERLTGQGLITDLFIRVDATFVNGASTVALLDGFSRVMNRISIEIDSEQLANITPSEQFNMMNILDKTQPSFLQVATAGAGLSPFIVYHIPLALPKKQFGYPARLATALPAGLCNNFVCRVEAASDYEGAILSTVGTGALSNVTISINALTALMSRDELKAHIARTGGLALFHDSIDNNAVNTATEIETRFKTGRGTLIGFYSRNQPLGALASTPSNVGVTTTRLVAGSSDFLVDSRHAELQDMSKLQNDVETMPPGAFYHTFAPHGDLTEGVPLTGINDLRLLQTFAPTPTNGFTRNITHLLLPGFYSRLAR